MSPLSLSRGASLSAAVLTVLWLAAPAWASPRAAPGEPTATVPSAAAGPRLAQVAAAPAKGVARKSPARAGTAKKGGDRSGKTQGAGAKAPAAEPSLSQAMTAIRVHLAAAGEAGKPSDLATLMIGSILETGFVQFVHTHYALAGTGQSLRSGAMPASAVGIAAQDMARNHARLQQAYRALAAQQEFRGQLAGLFTDMADNAQRAVVAAQALAAWAEHRDDPSRAKAFETALETSRQSVQALGRKGAGR